VCWHLGELGEGIDGLAETMLTGVAEPPEIGRAAHPMGVCGYEKGVCRPGDWVGVAGPGLFGSRVTRSQSAVIVAFSVWRWVDVGMMTAAHVYRPTSEKYRGHIIRHDLTNAVKTPIG
jgi:hypothetical protein